MNNLIKQLECTSVKETQVKLLQEIGKELLTDYVIKVGDVMVKPLWVEAYYFNAGTGFTDASVHRNECQSQYGVLYFHHNTDDQRSGVDICLSCGEYYLSYLLKYTLVNGAFKTQAQLSSMIPQDERLAIARDINQRFVTETGEKRSLPQKIELLKAYIDAVYSDDQIATEEQKAEISRKLVGEYWKSLFE